MNPILALIAETLGRNDQIHTVELDENVLEIWADDHVFELTVTHQSLAEEHPDSMVELD